VRGEVAVVVRRWPRPVFKQFLSKHPRKRDQGACASCEVAHVLTFFMASLKQIRAARRNGRLGGRPKIASNELVCFDGPLKGIVHFMFPAPYQKPMTVRLKRVCTPKHSLSVREVECLYRIEGEGLRFIRTISSKRAQFIVGVGRKSKVVELKKL